MYRLWLWTWFLSLVNPSVPFSWDLGLLGYGKLANNVQKGDILDVRYEELDPDDWFIQEAAKITGIPLSELDTCQQKIVLKLKSSCGNLNDEGISRLAIGLLNCQSYIEGRQTYPCDENMSLKSCTKEMNPEIWNAYHLISNRARAVCYTARQQHFRAMAEMIVNKLVATTKNHLENIENFQEKQKSIQDESVSTIENLSKNHRQILITLSKIRTFETSLSSNMKDGIEKSKKANEFIDRNYKLLSDFKNAFEQGIQKSEIQVQNQLKESQAEHIKMLEQIKSLKNTIIDMKNMMDRTSSDFDSNNIKISAEYESTLNKINQVNEHLDKILLWSSNAKNIIGKAFTDLENFSGEDASQLIFILFTSVHILMFLGAMVIFSFFNAPIFARIVLFTGAPLNFYFLSLYHVKEIHGLWFYGFVFILGLVHSVIVFLKKDVPIVKINGSVPVDTKDQDNSNINNKPLHKVDEWLEGRNNYSNGIHPVRKLIEIDDNTSVASTVRRRDLRTSTPASSKSGLKYCLGKNIMGQYCGNATTKDSCYCRHHGKGK